MSGRPVFPRILGFSDFAVLLSGVGAAFYLGRTEGLIGVAKALVWPMVLVYRLFQSLEGG